MIVAGIDPGLVRTSVCIMRHGVRSLMQPDVRLDYEISNFGFSLTTTASENEKADRLLHVAREVSDLLVFHKVSIAAIEGYSFGSKMNREVMGEIGGAIRAFVRHRWISIQVIPVKTVRSVIFPSGFSAKKGDAKKELARRLKDAGLVFKNDDDADAFLIAETLWRSKMGG